MVLGASDERQRIPAWAADIRPGVDLQQLEVELGILSRLLLLDPRNVDTPERLRNRLSLLGGTLAAIIEGVGTKVPYWKEEFELGDGGKLLATVAPAATRGGIAGQTQVYISAFRSLPRELDLTFTRIPDSSLVGIEKGYVSEGFNEYTLPWGVDKTDLQGRAVLVDAVVGDFAQSRKIARYPAIARALHIRSSR